MRIHTSHPTHLTLCTRRAPCAHTPHAQHTCTARHARMRTHISHPTHPVDTALRAHMHTRISHPTHVTLRACAHLPHAPNTLNDTARMRTHTSHPTHLVTLRARMQLWRRCAHLQPGLGVDVDVEDLGKEPPAPLPTRHPLHAGKLRPAGRPHHRHVLPARHQPSLVCYYVRSQSPSV